MACFIKVPFFNYFWVSDSGVSHMSMYTATPMPCGTLQATKYYNSVSSTVIHISV